MSRITPRTSLLALTTASALGVVAVAAHADPLPTHHQHDAVRRAAAAHAETGHVPADQVLTLDLVASPADLPGLRAYARDVVTPGSAHYRQFLSSAEVSRRFGPSAADYARVVAFAQSHGLTVIGGSRESMDVQVSGSVAAIEQAFSIRLNTYNHPTENRTYRAPDRELSVPAGTPIYHVSGLDNFSIPRPHLATRANTGATPKATTGSGPSASYLGSDMRAAYYGSGPLTGAGQVVGLLEYYGSNLNDLTTYYTNAGQTNTVPVNLIATDKTSLTCNYTGTSRTRCDDTEQTLDMTQVLGMAPGIAALNVYVGSTDTAILGAMVAANPLPLTIGCSWGWSPADPATLEPYFLRMVAQGQTFLAASGDASTWKATGSAAPWPADDPWVVSVGGTSLTTTGAGGAWAGETAWVDSGGGVTTNGFAIPAWQALPGVINATNNGSTTLRNGPDVSANADFTFYVCANQTTCTANKYGGTSFAAPMWAGYLALVNQSLAANGQGPVGFVNPVIYNQNLVGSTYALDFNDVTSGTSGSYSATTGYDLVTGWGSPTPALVGTLAGLVSAPSLTVSTLAGSLSIAEGATASTVVDVASAGGFSGAVTLAASGLPSGVSAAFNPATVTNYGASTLTLTASASAPVTTAVPVTITATSGSTTASTTVNTAVTVPPSYSLSIAPTALTVARGKSGTATLTESVTGGYSTKVTLTASGQPTGVTVSSSKSSLTGATTATITFKVASTAAVGTYTITLKGTAGTTSKTTTVALTVQ